MWRNAVQQAGNGLLAITEYILKGIGFLALFTVAGTRGAFLEKLSASFNPLTLFLDGGNAVYRQITGMAEVIVDYNNLEMPVFTELYTEGTVDGVMQGLNDVAGYIVAVDQNFTLEPISTITAALFGFGLFFVAGSVLRIIRQRDRDLLRVRLEKALWNMITPASAGKAPVKKAESDGLLKEALDDRKAQKKQKREKIATESETEEPVSPTSHGKLKLVKLSEVSDAKSKQQKEHGNEDVLSAEEQSDEQDSEENKKSSDWKTQIEFTSNHENKDTAERDVTPDKEASIQLASNGNGHHKNDSVVDEELEKSLIKHLIEQEEQQEEEENPPKKESAPPQNCTLNEFLERARSS